MSFGVVAEGSEVVEHLWGVGEVEVSRHKQGAGASRAVAHHRMAGGQRARSIRAVAQMPQIDLTAEGRRKGGTVARLQ